MQRLKKYWIIIVLVFFFSMYLKPAICFFILGSIAFVVVIDSIRVQKRLGSNGIDGIGRILSYDDDTPVIEFTPPGGETIAEKPYLYVSTDLSQIMPNHNQTGHEVPITYDPNDPTKFVLTGEKGINGIALVVFFLIGLALIAVGVACWLGHIKIGLNLF